jgi:hypothetical protein
MFDYNSFLLEKKENMLSGRKMRISGKVFDVSKRKRGCEIHHSPFYICAYT